MGRNPFGSRKPTRDTGPLAASPFPHLEEEIPNVAPEDSGIRAHIENIPTANFQPKKRTDKRTRDAVLFVRNLGDLREPLEQAAEKLGVPRDMLVRYLLETGLTQHRSGQAPLIPVLSQRLTLYPNQPSRPRRHKEITAKGMGFRGIPEQVRADLTLVAEELSVPSWQVVRRLLENGLEAWKQGTFTITVYTVETPAYTLYPEE